MKTVLIALMAIVIVCGGCRGENKTGDSRSSNHAPEEVVNRVKAFVRPHHVARLRESEPIVRQMAPPFVKCYRFQVPVSAKEGKASASDTIAELLVEMRSKRIVEYDCRIEGPRSGITIPVSDAKLISGRVLEKAGIVRKGLALKHISLSRAQREDDVDQYTIMWAEYTDIPEVGRVELPLSIYMEIDASSGALDSLSVREYPVIIDITSPRVSRSTAETIAQDKSGMTGVQVSSAGLKVCFDYRGIDEQTVELSVVNPRRFYEEVGKDRQILAWEVLLSGIPPRLQSGKQAQEVIHIPVLIDAMTGEVISMPMPV